MGKNDNNNSCTIEECKFGCPNRSVSSCPKERAEKMKRHKQGQIDFMTQVRGLHKNNQPVLTMKEIQEDSVYKVVEE